MPRCPSDRPTCRLDADAPQHGRNTGYDNHGCGCDPCRAAHRLWTRAKRSRCAATRTCPNCKGPGGEYAGGTCNTCREYQRRRGVPRPPEVYNPPPRICANCAMGLPVGKGLRHGRCEACARYFDRNGRERPERLWRAHVGAVEAARTETPDTVASDLTGPVGTGTSRGMPSPDRPLAGTAPTTTSGEARDG